MMKRSAFFIAVACICAILEEFVGSIAEYEVEVEREGQEPSISGYLERVSLVSDIDGVEDERTVLLMTVHAAKGLEFDTVFLTGMEEEMFPYRGIDGTSPEELEEERRLAYVAITRARKRLVISHAAARTIFGFTRYNRPSRFLNDIPAECVESVDLAWRASTGNTSLGSSESRWRPRRSYDDFDQRVEAATDEHYFTSDAFESTAETGHETGAGSTIDYTAFDDVEPTSHAVRRGTRVTHERFGRGTVQSVAPGRARCP